MSFQQEQGIVPQLEKFLGHFGPLKTMLTCLCMFSALAGCATVDLNARAPAPPMDLKQAREYVAQRDRLLSYLEYELNEKSRACYDKFFVSRCLEDVRIQGAALRRAHLEAQGQADDIIRMDEYGKRQRDKPRATN